MKIFSRLGHVLLICSSLIIAIPAHSADSSTTTKAGVKTVKKQELSANSALVIDLKTNEIIYSNNPDAVKPIASVTKLMTAIVTLDAKLPMDAKLPITIKDAKEMKGVHSSKDRQWNQSKRYAIADINVIWKPRRGKPCPPLSGRL